jgi:16S rRNA (uracil1498-N3)-methyltransferase
MRIFRIFCARALAPGQLIELDEPARRHVSQVLRLRAGQSLVLFDGSGRDFAAELTRCDRKACTARVGEPIAAEASSALQLHLGIGISRGERMDVAIQKSVELGVNTITPLLTGRSVVQLDDERRARRLAHWRAVVIGACEQSGRSLLPTLHPVSTLPDWLAARRGGLMLYHRASRSLAALAAPGPQLHLLIGPEGGLSESERALARAADYLEVRLGPRVLRTETAPLAALAAIQALWGDFR